MNAVTRSFRPGRQIVLLLACAGLLLSTVSLAPPADDETVRRLQAWRADLDYLYEQIEEPSSLRLIFKHKGIDWKQVRKQADKRFKKLASSAVKHKRRDSLADKAAFYGVLRFVIGQLRDSHAYLELDDDIPEAWRSTQPVRYNAGIEFQQGFGDVIAVSNTFAGRGSNSPLYGRGIRHEGTILESVNGVKAKPFFDERAERLYLDGGFKSTLGRAYSEALNGLDIPEDGKLALVFRVLDMPEAARKNYVALDRKKRKRAIKKLKWKQKKVTLRASECKQTRNPRNFVFMHLRPGKLNATSAPGVWYRTLDSGIGYVRYSKVSGKSLKGMQEACAALSQCKGMILDMRTNGGGGESAMEAFDSKQGAWNKKLAVLMGPRSMSAAETEIWKLFRLRDQRLCDLRSFGRTTAGASGDKIRFALPSGFAKGRFVFKHWHGGRSQIEGIGLEPDEIVDQDVVELSLGMDSCIRAAERWIGD